MTWIYLIRHGCADTAGSDYDRLSLQGKKQADLLADYLIKEDLNIKFFATGTLRRHIETSEPFLKLYVGKTTDLSPVRIPEMDEIDVKVWLGQMHKLKKEDPEFPGLFEEWKALRSENHDARKQFLRLTEKVVRSWAQDEDRSELSFRAFHDRAAETIKKIPALGDEEACVIFSSAGPISVLVAKSLGIEGIAGLSFMQRLMNTSITLMKMENGKLDLHTFNSTPHLPKSMRTLI